MTFELESYYLPAESFNHQTNNIREKDWTSVHDTGLAEDPAHYLPAESINHQNNKLHTALAEDWITRPTTCTQLWLRTGP